MIAGILRGAAPYLAAAALVLGIWMLFRHIGLQNELLDTQRSSIASAVEDLKSLREINQANARHMQDMLTANQHVATTLSKRTTEIRRLQRDIEEIRLWADQYLPADIKRLRTRPALSGAAAYGAGVPEGHTMPSEPSQSPDQRGSEPAD